MIITNINMNFIPKLKYNEEYKKTTESIHSSHIIYKDFLGSKHEMYDFILNFNSSFNNYQNEFMNKKLYYDGFGYLCLDYYEIVKKKNDNAIEKAFDYFKLNSN